MATDCRLIQGDALTRLRQTDSGSAHCLAGSPEGGVVLDPFSGAATVGVVCQRLGRRFVGIELNPDYIRMSRQRLKAAKAKQRQLARAA